MPHPALIQLFAGAEASAPFDLNDFGNLLYWFDADDAGTITDAGSGAVSQWNDKSGNARHITQATGGSRPATGTHTINGKNVLHFDGGDWLGRTTVAGDLIWTGSAAFTVIAVIKTATTNCTPIGEANASSTSPNNQPIVLSGGQLAAAARGTNGSSDQEYITDSDTTVNDDAPHIVVTVDNGSNAVYHRVDGDPTTSDNASSPESYTRDETVSLSLFSIGALNRSGGAVAHMTGDVAEVIIYRGALPGGVPDAYWSQIEGYLSAKWGITL